jgi:hypothetical protein
MPYVTGAQIITHVRKTGATADDTAWAATCAAAIEAVIARRMGTTTITAGMTAELTRAALQAGAAAYMERDAPHGIQSFGPDGETVRLSATLGRSLEPVFHQLIGPGIG